MEPDFFVAQLGWVLGFGFFENCSSKKDFEIFRFFDKNSIEKNRKKGIQFFFNDMRWFSLLIFGKMSYHISELLSKSKN